MNYITKTRIKKELEMFENSPPPGISCSCSDDKLNKFNAQIMGAIGTPFEDGIFTLDIQIPNRYPFEPPGVRFVTPIYHPNVDTLGRICLDTLKPPPQGSWKPHLNIAAVLMMIRVLMAEPGEKDPLMTDIWQEYKYDYVTYVRKAKDWTKRHASGEHIPDKAAKRLAAEDDDLRLSVTAQQAGKRDLDKHDVFQQREGISPCDDPLAKRSCLGGRDSKALGDIANTLIRNNCSDTPGMSSSTITNINTHSNNN